MAQSNGELALVADIGGTNARFALADLDAPGRPRLHHQRKLAGDHFASVQHAIRHFIAEVRDHPPIRRAAIAVASPVIGDVIRLTNRAWSFNSTGLEQELGLDELRVINDFGAAARAVPVLAEDEQMIIHHGDAERPLPPISFIGPGTGMGVALIAGYGSDRWQVIETEGGHVSYAPQGSEEAEIHDWLLSRHDRVSVERVLSGDGLAYIHAALAGKDPSKTHTPKSALAEPAWIVQQALAGEDVIARRALARFCAILGSFAGDCALIHGARTVAIAGGMTPRFAGFLRASAFVERFLAKGRFAAWMERIRVALVTHPEPGLLGAAMTLREQKHF